MGLPGPTETVQGEGHSVRAGAEAGTAGLACHSLHEPFDVAGVDGRTHGAQAQSTPAAP